VDPRQTRYRSAPQQAKQHGFRLIIPRMRSHHDIDHVVVYQLLKKFQPFLAGAFLEVSARLACRTACREHVNRDSRFGGQMPAKLLVPLGIRAAQTVVHVDRAQQPSIPHVEQQQQQGRGIRSAGDGNADACSGWR
jgi:hypothetical protein